MSDSNALFLLDSKIEPFFFTVVVKDKEVIRIDSEGKIFWNSREVVTDEDFRCMMVQMAQTLINWTNDRSDILSC